jgi:hypothetical protein
VSILTASKVQKRYRTQDRELLALEDLKGFLTNELIADCNTYDKERIRKMAREWK